MKETLNNRRFLRLGLNFVHTLSSVNLWHFVWISFVLSEILTALMALLLKGSITGDYLITGGVVSLIVSGLVLFILRITMQVRLDNEILRTEIEKQRITAEGLSKALDFHSLMMETIPDLLYVLNPVGTVIKWNAKAQETSGYNRDEIRGRHALSFIAEEDRDDARAGLEEAYLKGSAARELRLLTKDRKKIMHRFSGAAIKDESGKFLGFIGIGRDISQMKKIEEEMQRAQKLESVGILAGGIAHDFNYLLTSIIENVRLAVIHADRKDVLRECLLKSQKASLRAKELTKQLFGFSRGGFPVKKLLPLGSLIREYTEIAVCGSNCSYQYRIADDLWDAEVDEGQIGQVIKALVINAIEAMPDGGRVIITAENVEVSSEKLPPLRDGKYVKISVSDFGVGIQKDLLQKIFDPYFTNKENGTGLGLTITYAIIRNHDGHIRVESDPGKGSTFDIYLPAGC